MPVMPPLVSTSSTRKPRLSPKAWPLSHGVLGHGTRSVVVRMALMVRSVMTCSRPDEFPVGYIINGNVEVREPAMAGSRCRHREAGACLQKTSGPSRRLEHRDMRRFRIGRFLQCCIGAGAGTRKSACDSAGVEMPLWIWLERL